MHVVIARNWWSLVIRGLVGILFGIITFAWPGITFAAPDKAKLLVVETVLPNESAWAAGHGEHFGNHLDINMLVLTGGRERTPDEFVKLFADCGWQLARVIPTPTPYSIVEAVAA